jgi:Concanavalin A-like lectin/glucanases superfamily
MRFPLSAGPARLWPSGSVKPAPGPYAVDWGHPLAAGLACVLAEEFPLRDAVTGTLLARGSANTLVMTPYGGANGCDGSINSQMGYGNAFAPLTTSNGNGLGDFSLFVIASPAASGSGGASIFGQDDDASGDGCLIAVNYNATFGNHSGGVIASIYLGGGGNYDNAYSSSGCDGQLHAFAMTRSLAANSVGLWIDGRSAATTTLSADRNILAGSAPHIFLGGCPDDSVPAINGAIVFAAAWNRALSASEILQLSLDPYVFLAPVAPGLPALLATAAPGSPQPYRRPNQHLYRR